MTLIKPFLRRLDRVELGGQKIGGSSQRSIIRDHVSDGFSGDIGEGLRGGQLIRPGFDIPEDVT